MHRVDGAYALALDPHVAPLFTAADWGGEQMNQGGLRIPTNIAEAFVQRIAAGERHASGL
jgi:hypothetical protein